MGVCASPDGVALPVGPTVPVPTAYFPLTNGSTFSWPIPEYWAYNTSAIQSKQTKFVKDSYFGTVVQCNASLGELRCYDVPCTVPKQLLQLMLWYGKDVTVPHIQQLSAVFAQMPICIGLERVKQHHCRIQPGN